MRLHVLPSIGNKTIFHVTPEDIEGLYGVWAKQGAKPNTIESRSITLSSLFSHARRHRTIAKNPIKEAEKPSNHLIPIDERQLPSLEEITAIAHSIGNRLEPAICLMACGGLRIGESLGVLPGDFQGGTLCA